MGSDVGSESIAELLKSLESAFLPSHYKAVEEKLLAREETWRKKYQKMKVKLDGLRTADNVLNASTANLWRDERTRLKDQIAALTLEKETLQVENADWRRHYEDLEKRLSHIEKAITEIQNDTPTGVPRETENNGVSSTQKVKWPAFWDEIVFRTPRMASKSPPAAKVNGKGTVLQIIDSDDDSVVIGDLVGEKSGPRKVTGSNSSLQTNGDKTIEVVKQGGRSFIEVSEKTSEGLKRGRSCIINLSDHENEIGRRILRKSGAFSVIREADRSSSKPPVDTVVLDKFQENTVLGTDSNRNGTAKGDSCSSLQRTQDVKIKEWNSASEMLADFSKDDELCIRAVCALRREQKCEGSSLNLSSLQRGTLIEFLTNGDPQGRLRRSVTELQKFNADLIQDCRQIAVDHLNELFRIYQKKEDPFFPHP